MRDRQSTAKPWLVSAGGSLRWPQELLEEDEEGNLSLDLTKLCGHHHFTEVGCLKLVEFQAGGEGRPRCLKQHPVATRLQFQSASNVCKFYLQTKGTMRGADGKLKRGKECCARYHPRTIRYMAIVAQLQQMNSPLLAYVPESDREPALDDDGDIQMGDRTLLVVGTPVDDLPADVIAEYKKLTGYGPGAFFDNAMALNAREFHRLHVERCLDPEVLGRLIQLKRSAGTPLPDEAFARHLAVLVDKDSPHPELPGYPYGLDGKSSFTPWEKFLGGIIDDEKDSVTLVREGSAIHVHPGYISMMPDFLGIDKGPELLARQARYKESDQAADTEARIAELMKRVEPFERAPPEAAATAASGPSTGGTALIRTTRVFGTGRRPPGTAAPPKGAVPPGAPPAASPGQLVQGGSATPQAS